MRSLPPAGARRPRPGRRPLESRAHDPLDAADIEELEGERPRTRGIDAARAVAFGEPQGKPGIP